jgi:hypothetical protein
MTDQHKGAAVERMTYQRDGDARCIKHGALLFSERTFDGLSREAAARKLRGSERGMTS